MLPSNKDLILKEKVKLYDNMARINDCEGRLLAELQIYPTPRITWEFEMLGDIQCDFPLDFNNPDNPTSSLIGHVFSIEEPYPDGSSNGLEPRQALHGVTNQAVYRNIGASAHKFTFYLPNTKLQEKSLNQGTLQKTVKETDTDRKVESGEEGKYVNSPVDDTWSIRLEIRHDPLAWLKPKNQNIGTLITTVGQLYQPKYNAVEPETFSELQSVTLASALERLEHLGRLLSYANGGYTSPLYIEGYQYSQNRKGSPVKTSSAVALASRITPLEQLGLSWVVLWSDLTEYVRCFSTFERMMQEQSWIDTFDFVLIQYFQATQPRIAWPVAASAVGAALERLSYTILVEEETDGTKKDKRELLFSIKDQKKARDEWNLGKKPGQENISFTVKRLRLLLERIGLTKKRGYNDLDDVSSFLKIRNDAVHPRIGNLTQDQRWKYIDQAIQWIDEVLLWRLGYSGKYLDRAQIWKPPTTSRYDLSTRDPSW